jgi:hypothetical protein
MTVRELIAELQKCELEARVEIDNPPTLGAKAVPCEGIGAVSHERVILWANG